MQTKPIYKTDYLKIVTFISLFTCLNLVFFALYQPYYYKYHYSVNNKILANESQSEERDHPRRLCGGSRFFQLMSQTMIKRN